MKKLFEYWKLKQKLKFLRVIWTNELRVLLKTADKIRKIRIGNDYISKNMWYLTCRRMSYREAKGTDLLILLQIYFIKIPCSSSLYILLTAQKVVSLDTVTLLWTLYCTKHRNWFHESLMMIDIFTKLPFKI